MCVAGRSLARAHLFVGLASLLRGFFRSPPCVPPGCGSCLSGALISRVPLRFVLSLRCARYSFRGVKRTRRQPTRKMPSGVGSTAHSPVSRWETCKLARSIPSPACLAGNASCSCIGLAQASSILGNGIPGTIDNKGNSYGATKRIKEKEVVCQKLITRCMRTHPCACPTACFTMRLRSGEPMGPRLPQRMKAE